MKKKNKLQIYRTKRPNPNSREVSRNFSKFGQNPKKLRVLASDRRFPQMTGQPPDYTHRLLLLIC